MIETHRKIASGTGLYCDCGNKWTSPGGWALLKLNGRVRWRERAEVERNV